MKVDDRSEAAPARRASEPGRFQDTLQRKAPPPGGPASLRRGQVLPPASRVPPTPPPRGATQGVTRALPGPALAGAEHLGQVRQGLSTEAHRLRDVRGEAHQHHQEKLHQRVTELLARELAREPPPGSEPPSRAGRGGSGELRPAVAAEPPGGPPGTAVEGPGGTRADAPEAPAPEVRVQSTLALIEKIELFVKSHRPALALRLGGAWDARVEVERTGAGEVALRIQGHRGPLAPRELERLREALSARGLKLSALSNT